MRIQSQRARRVGILIGLLVAAGFVGAGYLGYRLTREPYFDWEDANAIEAREAQRKLRLYDTSYAQGDRGFVRLSQLEINSYLKELISTNSAAGTSANPPPAVEETNSPASTAEPPDAMAKRGLQLTRIGVQLGKTNVTLFSWAERRVFGCPIRFVVQRGFHIQQSGANRWDLPMDSIRVGEVQIPARYWNKLEPAIRTLDEPLEGKFAWATNIQAMLITKNEISQRPELRLYTYKPIPDEDLR